MKRTLLTQIITATLLIVNIGISQAGFYGGPSIPTTPYLRSYNRAITKSNNFVRIDFRQNRPFSGNFIAHGSGSCASCCSACEIDIDIDSASYESAYKHMQGVSVEYGAIRRKNLEVSLGALWLTSDSKTVKFGKFGGITPIHGTFTDYNEKGIFLAARQKYYRTGKSWYPFVFGSLGVSLVDAIDIAMLSNDGYFNPGWMPLYDDSIVFKGTFGVGLSVNLGKSFEIGGEVGVGYQSALNAIDSHLADFNLEEINDTKGMWFFPMKVFGKYRF